LVGIIASCNNVDFGYSKDAPLLKGVSVTVDSTSRIGVIGANGTGKSTLIKLLMGELEANSGEIKRLPGVRVALFSQHHMDNLDLSLNCIDNFLAVFPKVHPQQARRHLGSMGITGELSLQRVRTLSGGQKSRVAFALITWKKPHFIIMDGTMLQRNTFLYTAHSRACGCDTSLLHPFFQP
jgi:ATP-binding cassette subfamily F protein 3